MKGVILVGGQGTRLRPLTSRIPKPMVPILNAPFLERMIGWVRSHGIHDIVLAIHYLPDPIRDCLGDGSRLGVRLSYAEEPQPLGTAGAVKNAAGLLDDTCFVFNGDILTDLDLGAMLRAHRQAGAAASISLTPVDDPSAFGVVETDSDGRVRRFIEKPPRDEAPSNMINAGTYILEPHVLDLVPSGTFWMFERQLFPDLLTRGDLVVGFPSDSYWVDLGTPAKYLDAHVDALEGRCDLQLGPKTSALGWIDPTARIGKRAKIVGPVFVGPGAIIEDGAQVGPYVVLGAGTSVGAAVHIRRTVVWDGASITGGQIRDAVIANGARMAGNADDAVIGPDAIVERDNLLANGVRVGAGAHIHAGAVTFA